MVDDVVNDSTKLPSVKAREGSGDAYQGWSRCRRPIGGVSQPKVLEDVQVRLTDYVVGLVYQD